MNCVKIKQDAYHVVWVFSFSYLVIFDRIIISRFERGIGRRKKVNADRKTEANPNIENELLKLKR